EPEANLYVTQMAADLQGLDASRFVEAWLTVLRRHATLRSGFVWQGDLPVPLQAVFRDVELPVKLHDWRQRTVDDAALTELAKTDYERGFDLHQAPLLRLTLVSLAGGMTHLIWTCHHLLLDGWSTSLLLGEVMEIYAGAEPRTSPGSYRDYIAWLQCQDKTGGEAFWRRQLAGVNAPCLLAAAINKPQDSGNGYWICRLDAAETQHLQTAAQQQRITLNTLLQGAWALLLRHYTGQSRVVFGATVAGRPGDLPGAETLLGLFINTLPVAIEISPSMPLAEWLRGLQADNLRLREFEYLPLYDIQRWTGVGGDLFDTLLVFENYPVDEALQQSGSGLSIGNVNQHDVTNYPLTVDVAVGTMLEIGFDYARSHFGEDDIRRIGDCLRTLLLAIGQHADAAIGSIGYGAFDGAQTHPIAPKRLDERLLLQTISHQAATHPDAEALVCAGQVLSYADLQSQANRLAHHLLASGVKAGDVVGLCLPRSADMIVASLAVWQCGAAFLPLDPDYPSERLRYLLDDAGATWLIGGDVGGGLGDGRVGTARAHAESKPTVGNGIAHPTLKALNPIDLSRLDLSAYPDTPPALVTHPEQTAYLIYTSGSTGQPKGVAVGHGALARHCQAMAEVYAMQAGDVCLHFASFSFDAAIEQWAVPLACGAKVVISDQTLWSVEQTLAAIENHGITHIDLPPAYLSELARHIQQPEQAPVLTSCTVGGEA
ncbi:condensation domain-containing protein, partial [Methylomonas rivi]